MRFRKASQLASKSGPRAPKGGKRRPGQSKRGQERPRAGTREAQEPPRAAPEAHGSGPGRPRDGPGGAGRDPGAAHERPKGPGGAQKGSPDAKTFSFLSLTDVFEGVDAPKTHHVQGFFLTAQASLSSLLDVLVEARARPARQMKTLFEITGRKVFRDNCGTDVHWPVSTKLSD